jgi:hypothetical protein
MISRQLVCSCALSWLVLWGARADAASLVVAAPVASLAVGARFEVRVEGVGFPYGVDGGDFSVAWDPSSLSFVSIEVDDPPWDLSAFDDSSAPLGRLDFVDVFSTVDTPGMNGSSFGIATLTFDALAPGVGWIELAPGIVGWSLEGDTLDDVSYEAASVEVVAEPGSALLLALGLGLLSGARRLGARC